jgi:WD40 repeat protein
MTSKIRCSYIGYNQYDEIDPSTCISFNLFGDKLYAGSNRMIRCFDVANPGVYDNIPTCKSRRDPMGQKGIISTISFNPDYSNSYAVGSYASSVGIYVENMEGCALEIRDIGMDVTCIKWSPNGNNIWVGGRKNSNIVCWDVRNTRSEIGKVRRLCTSNQKMMFDLDPWGNFLCTGTQDGSLLIYDVNNFNLVHEINSDSDCINSVQFHPSSSLVGVVTGQRHFVENDSDSDSDVDLITNSENLKKKPINYCFDMYKFGIIK